MLVGYRKLSTLCVAAAPLPATELLQVLHANLSSLGLSKTLPYLAMFVASNAGGWAGDTLINRGKFSVAAGRKAVNTAGFAVATAAIMFMPGGWLNKHASDACMQQRKCSRGDGF
jgi:hypothetical protein